MSEVEKALPLTVSVPDYGRAAFDIGENSSYAAASRGDFPTLEIGGLKRVPVRTALRRLAGDDPEVLKAVTEDFASKFLKMKDHAA